MDFILKMNYNHVFKLIEKAIEEKIDEKIWQQYLFELEHLDHNKIKNYDDYKKKMTQSIIPTEINKMSEKEKDNLDKKIDRIKDNYENMKKIEL